METSNFITFGALSTIVLSVMGFMLRRMVHESDRLRIEQSTQIGELAKRIGEFAKEQAIMNERILRLLKIDEKYSDVERKLLQLQEYENSSKTRFNELSNNINGIVGILVKNGIKIDTIFHGEPWKF